MATIPLTAKNMVLSTPLSVAYGGTAVNSVTSVPTASSWAGWDANRNLSANNVMEGYSTTVTSSTVKILTSSSPYQQYFTGTVGQLVVMPITSTLVLGQSWNIVNNSTSEVDVETSASVVMAYMGPNEQIIITCILTSGTTAASWSINNNTIAVNSVVTGIVRTDTRPTVFSGSGSPDTFNFGGLSSGSYWFSIVTTGGGTVTTFFATFSNVSSTLYTGGIAGNNISVIVSGTSISWYSNNGISYSGQVTYLLLD